MDRVFPRRPDGLRESPPECLVCDMKVDCLKTALASPQGAAVERGGVARNTVVGKMARGLKRWSNLKSSRQRESSSKDRG